MRHVYRCYAEASGQGWEAFCIELDIAVQADSLDDAIDELHKAIQVYLESVSDVPEGQRAHLLYRPAPFRMRLKFFWLMVRGLFTAGVADDRRHAHGFTCAAPA